MRITTDMMYNRTILDLSRNLDRDMSPENRVSSGRRTNIPSDDPVGTHHDLHSRANLSRMLSDVEDADTVTAVCDLARQESLYKAALMAGSSVMQYSLVDFLRG